MAQSTKQPPTESKRFITALRSLTVASIKMYTRNVSGMFFSLFIPLALILIFGFLFKSNISKTKIGLTNYSQTELSHKFVDTLKGIEAFDIQESDETTAAEKLGKGNVDLQIVVPEEFGDLDHANHISTGDPDHPAHQFKQVKVQSYYNEARPQVGQPTSLVVNQIVSGFNQGITQAPTIIGYETKGVKTNNLNAIDFFLPGILAMSIMQLGIFSVAFGFISYKTSGALRRLQATPVHPFSFVLAQGVTRILLSLVQVALLLALGVFLFQVKLVGNVFELMTLVLLGSAVFLGFGFAIAGWAKDENQAAPVAQLIQFPMLFLSGVFFARDGLPHWLLRITDYFPLTFLVDSMRKVSTEGASLWAVRGDVLGLVIWGIIVYFIAVRVFKWE